MLRRFLFNLRMSFRMWVRNRTKPLTLEEAEEKKGFWARVYLGTGIVGFCYITYQTFSSTNSEIFSQSLPISPKLLSGKKETERFRVIKYSGFTKVSDETITLKEAIERKESEESAKNDSTESI